MSWRTAAVVTFMEWRVSLAAIDQVGTDASDRLRSLGVRAPFLAFWLRAAAAQLHPDDEAHVVIAYDEGLLSFDAWVREKRVYGADDYVG